MKNQGIEKKIAKSIENCMPDILETILASCNEQKEGVIMPNFIKKKNKMIKIIAACAASVLIFSGAFLSYVFYNNNYGVDSVIGLDVNPSIELSVNKKDRIIDVSLLNKDAEKILENLDLEGSNLNVAVHAIIGSMVKNGYINDLQNSILISVDNDDEQRGKSLEEQLVSEINEILKNNSVNGSLLSQKKSTDSKISALAEKYNISESKAQLIQDIIANNPLYKAEDLVKLNINELNVLISSDKITVNDITTEGTASIKSYISKDKALNIVLKSGNVLRKDISNVEIEFDCDDGSVIYEIEFILNGKEYEYEVDAKTGEITKAADEELDYKPSNTTKSQYNSSNIISASKAKSIALNDVGVNSSQVYDLSCEKDYENGVMIYEVSFECGDYEYEYEINSENGKIIHREKEYNDEPINKPKTTAKKTKSVSYISAAKAKNIALSSADISSSKAYDLECDFDKDDGKAVYEVSFKSGVYEFDYEIDAQSGEIISASKEKDD